MLRDAIGCEEFTRRHEVGLGEVPGAETWDTAKSFKA